MAERRRTRRDGGVWSVATAERWRLRHLLRCGVTRNAVVFSCCFHHARHRGRRQKGTLRHGVGTLGALAQLREQGT